MLSEPILIDTGAFAALFDPHDRYHAVCLAQFQRLRVGKGYTCWPVIVEAVHLARKHLRQRDQLLTTIATGEFPLLQLGEADIPSIQQVLQKYHDQQIDLADASLVHLAQREGIATIFTFDRRHFSVLRRADGKSFRLLPEID